MKKRNLLALVMSTIMLLSTVGCGKKDTSETAGNFVDGNFVPAKDMEISVWSTQGSD